MMLKSSRFRRTISQSVKFLIPCLLLPVYCCGYRYKLPLFVLVKIFEAFYVKDIRVVFHTSDLEEEHLVLNIGKIVSNDFLLSSFLSLQSEEISNHCQSTTVKVAHFVVLNDNYTLDFVKELFNKSVPVSTKMWFLLASEELDPFTEFRDVSFPYSSFVYLIVSSEDKVLVYDVYRIQQDGPLLVSLTASWNIRGKVIVDKQHIFKRRRDLRGQHIVVTALENPPMTYLNYNNGIFSLSGYTADLWHSLQSILNFTYEVVPPADDKFGKYNPETKEWNGMIDQLTRGEADVAVTTMSQTPRRSEVIRFSTSVLRSSERLFVKAEVSNFTWSSFLLPFSLSLWLSLGFFILILPIAQAGLCRAAGSDGLENNRDPMVFSTGQWLLYTFGVFCQQGMYTTPTCAPSRIVLYVTLVSSLIVYNAYSAALFSHLTVQKKSLPFDSLDGLLRSRYSVGVLKDSSLTDMLEENNEESYGRTLMKVMQNPKSNLVPTRLAGFQKACREKFAFFSLYESYEGFREKLPCNLLNVKTEENFDSFMYFSMRSDYPYRKLFDHYLRWLNEVGVRQKLQLHWWPPQTTDLPKRVLGLNIERVSFSFICLATGMLLSILLLFMEILNHKYIRKEPSTSEASANEISMNLGVKEYLGHEK